MEHHSRLAFLRHFFHALLGFTVFVGSGVMAWIAIDVRSYIEIYSIEPTQEVFRQSEPVTLFVNRTLFKDFWGAYDVTIRNAETGHVLCSSGMQQIPYRVLSVDGNKIGLPNPLLLSWWAFGGTCTEILKDPIPPGVYSMLTCHWVLRPLWVLPSKRHCWHEPFFEVVEG